MPFELQPTIENAWIRLEPLEGGDFDALYAVASDPKIWEQHPNKTRHQRDVFATYFKGAIASGGAFRVLDKASGALIGSSRYYDFDEPGCTIAVGYTFIARDRWGGKYNGALKSLMLDHAFKFVDRVIFHIGVDNLRSRRAMEKIGGVYAGDIAVAYYGEPGQRNAIYEIEAAAWAASRAAGLVAG